MKYKMNSNTETFLISFTLIECFKKLFEQIVFNTRPKFEQAMWIDMDKSVQEKNLSQALQTNNKQFKNTATFLTGYNGFFSVTNKNINFYSAITDTQDGVYQITIPPGVYGLEALKEETKRIIVEKKCHHTEQDHPF